MIFHRLWNHQAVHAEEGAASIATRGTLWGQAEGQHRCKDGADELSTAGGWVYHGFPWYTMGFIGVIAAVITINNG